MTTPKPPEFSAVLLAAGRSTRMGRDKALLEIAGVPLWRRQREVLGRAGAAEIFVSARADQAWAAAENVVRDAVPDGGPLGGIAAALERAAHPHLAVLAVDLPRMEPAWFAALLADCAPAAGAVGRHGGDGGFFEPLAAVYPRALLPFAAAALARGEFSLQRLLTAAVAQRLMRVREIGPAEAAMLANWNEPAP